MASESAFERDLIERIKDLLPGCEIFKNDSSLIPGIPDRLILHGKRWAMLEFKASQYSPRTQIQEYYISIFNEMSFARFIYPENCGEVLRELQQSFRA